MKQIDALSFKRLFESKNQELTIFYSYATESEEAKPEEAKSALTKESNLSELSKELRQNSKSLSLESVQQGNLPDLDKETEVFVICDYGQISELTALYLETAGFTNVSNVQGGIEAFEKESS